MTRLDRAILLRDAALVVRDVADHDEFAIVLSRYDGHSWLSVLADVKGELGTVFDIEWTPAGQIELMCFRRGSWETELLGEMKNLIGKDVPSC